MDWLTRTPFPAKREGFFIEMQRSQGEFMPVSLKRQQEQFYELTY